MHSCWKMESVLLSVSPGIQPHSRAGPTLKCSGLTQTGCEEKERGRGGGRKGGGQNWEGKEVDVIWENAPI